MMNPKTPVRHRNSPPFYVSNPQKHVDSTYKTKKQPHTNPNEDPEKDLPPMLCTKKGRGRGVGTMVTVKTL